MDTMGDSTDSRTASTVEGSSTPKEPWRDVNEICGGCNKRWGAHLGDECEPFIKRLDEERELFIPTGRYRSAGGQEYSQPPHVYEAAIRQALSELDTVFYKFERAGGIWEVAARGVPLGAMSWASNVENGLKNAKAILEQAVAKAREAQASDSGSLVSDGETKK